VTFRLILPSRCRVADPVPASDSASASDRMYFCIHSKCCPRFRSNSHSFKERSTLPQILVMVMVMVLVLAYCSARPGRSFVPAFLGRSCLPSVDPAFPLWILDPLGFIEPFLPSFYRLLARARLVQHVQWRSSVQDRLVVLLQCHCQLALQMSLSEYNVG
jgi:hypothetical protein